MSRLVDRDDLHSESADAGRRGSHTVGEQDHRTAHPASAQIQRLEDRLRVADADVDQRDFKAPLAAHAGRGRSGRLPLVFDAHLVERGLEHRLQFVAADHQHAGAAGADGRAQDLP